MKEFDICIDYCEATNCKFCKYKDVTKAERIAIGDKLKEELGIDSK